jgi:hypothetical protein
MPKSLKLLLLLFFFANYRRKNKEGPQAEKWQKQRKRVKCELHCIPSTKKG